MRGRSARSTLGLAVVTALELAVPPRAGSVVMHSVPDLDDNVVELLRACPPGRTTTILAEDHVRARRRATALGLTDRVEIVERHSARGLWRYVRASVTLTSHGLHGSPRRRRGRMTVGLWHGEFGKSIGRFVGAPPKHYDRVPVSSGLSRAIRSAEFGLDPSRIHVTGTPRQAALHRDGQEDGRHVVWLPTFRSSTVVARQDGDPTSTGPTDVLARPELRELLEARDATMWFRPHPLSDDPVPSTSRRVRMADDRSLEELGRTLYDLLAQADVLVTDYSSVWVDFLLVDRPMVSFVPDLERYRDTRGLALEPHELWFPGPVVDDVDDLLAALGRALDEDPEEDASRRQSVRPLLHAGARDPVGAVWAWVEEVLA